MAINSLSASSYGLSGLVSGMNSQEMVEKLLSGTQSKIDKASQKKTTLQYKQLMYREVAAKVNALQSSFLSFTSKTNLLSNSFYNTMTTKINPPSGLSAAFSVSGSSTAQPGTVSMDYIEQLATARASKTNVAASGDVKGVMSQEAAAEFLKSYTGTDAVLNIKVGDKTATITDIAAKLGGMSQSGVAAEINAAFAGAGVEAEARFVNNKLQIKADDQNAFISISGNKNSLTNATLGTKMFGMAEMSGQGTLNAAIDTDAYLPSFQVNLDGRAQTIRLDLNTLRGFAEAATPTDISDARDGVVKDINDQLTRYFGTGVSATLSTDASDSPGTILFKSGSTSQKFTITGVAGAMNSLGITAGISNKLNTAMTLKELNFGQPLQGNQHTFKINGVEFSYAANASLTSIINDINNSNAGIKIAYLESEDRFTIQSSETGSGSVDFNAPGAITQTEGNLMTVLFGTAGSGVTQGQGIKVDMKAATPTAASSIADGGTFTFNVNGTDYKFTLSRKQDDPAFTLASFTEKMNEAFKDTFGKMTDGTQKVEFINDGGYLTIRTNDTSKVMKAVKENKDTNTNLLGFTSGQSNVAANGSVTLAQAGIHFGDGAGLSINMGGTNGWSQQTITFAASDFDDDMTLDAFMAKINAGVLAAYQAEIDAPGSGKTAAQLSDVAFDEYTGAFKLMGVDIPMEIVINKGSASGSDPSAKLENLFGQMSIAVSRDADLGGAASFMTETSQGQNAIFSINGSRMERASNTFTVEGLTYTLHESTVTGSQLIAGRPAGSTDPADYQLTYQSATKINVTRDTEKIVEGIQEFLKMYNETIDYLTGLHKADATYKDYAPLTKAQKETMSDREIELWEEKSKEGLLRNDPIVERVLSSLRTAMYTKPEGSSIAIYDLGIATSYYSKDGNFNAESIDDLRAAIEANPEAVRTLFAGEGGIMELVNTAINNATKSSYASPGYLTQVAGSNMLDTTSSIYKQIKEVDTQMVTLESRYWSEYDRYWKQFNTMEKLIQQMNTQSSWLSQQFAS